MHNNILSVKICEARGVEAKATINREHKGISPNNKPEDFGVKHDSKTIFYDYSWERESVSFFCPKLGSAKSQMLSALKCVGATKCRLLERRRWDLLQCELLNTSSVSLDLYGTDVKVYRSNLEEGKYLKGRASLVTVQKNNNLDWIYHWLNHHHRECGIDSVIIIDNGSYNYSLRDLAEVIQSSEVEAGVIISAPFRYGPVLKDRDRSLCYFQTAILNATYRRFLTECRFLLFCDIDELVYSNKKIFSSLPSRLLGFSRLRGYWAYAMEHKEAYLHEDHTDVDAKPFLGGEKYFIQPFLLRKTITLDIHGIETGSLFTRKLIHFLAAEKSSYFLHHRGITKDWKGVRTAVRGPGL